MIRRRKTLLLLLVVICIISGIIAYKNNQPKNVFEEIFYAEMDAAQVNDKLDQVQKKIDSATSKTLKKNVSSGTKRNTPLSNTEYFDVSVANFS